MIQTKAVEAKTHATSPVVYQRLTLKWSRISRLKRGKHTTVASVWGSSVVWYSRQRHCFAGSTERVPVLELNKVHG